MTSGCMRGRGFDDLPFGKKPSADRPKGDAHDRDMFRYQSSKLIDMQVKDLFCDATYDRLLEL